MSFGYPVCFVELFIRVNYCATNDYCPLHPSNSVQDVLLLDMVVPNELSLPEEVEQQVQHPLGPCVLLYSAWTSSPTAVSSFPRSMILFYGSFFNNKDVFS